MRNIFPAVILNLPKRWTFLIPSGCGLLDASLVSDPSISISNPSIVRMLRTRFGRWGLLTSSSSFSFRLFPWVLRPSSPLLCIFEKGRSDRAGEAATEREGNRLCLITSVVDPELEDSSPPAKFSFFCQRITSQPGPNRTFKTNIFLYCGLKQCRNSSSAFTWTTKLFPKFNVVSSYIWQLQTVKKAAKFLKFLF